MALWTLPNHAGAQSPATTASEVLRVTRSADDGGEGSLRWAIERNNAAPGRLRIELDPPGTAPYVIKLASPLPGRFLDFRDPWGNRIEIVGYDNIQFTKAPNVLRGMGLAHLSKNKSAIKELKDKGMAPS